MKVFLGNSLAMEILQGKTCILIKGMQIGSDVVEMFFDDFTHVRMFHEQDCCENVRVEDVVGDINDILGRELKLSEVVTNHNDLEYGSSTDTWYKFVTMEGAVTLRWLGTSNGYYSERVTEEISTFTLNQLSEQEQVAWDYWHEKHKILRLS